MDNEKFDQTVRPTVKIVLKLSQGQPIILKEGMFVSLEALDLSFLNNCLTREPDIAVYPLFGLSAANQEQPSPGEEPLDLSRYYGLELKDPLAAETLVSQLNGMSFVEEAYVEPRTGLPTTETPD